MPEILLTELKFWINNLARCFWTASKELNTKFAYAHRKLLGIFIQPSYFYEEHKPLIGFHSGSKRQRFLADPSADGIVKAHQK